MMEVLVMTTTWRNHALPYGQAQAPEPVEVQRTAPVVRRAAPPTSAAQPSRQRPQGSATARLKPMGAGRYLRCSKRH